MIFMMILGGVIAIISFVLIYLGVKISIEKYFIKISMDEYKRKKWWDKLICDKSKENTIKKEIKPFKFAVVADIQHRHDDNPITRSNALVNLQTTFDSLIADFNVKTKFLIQLGDFIDPHPEDEKSSTECLEDVLDIWNLIDIPKYHVLGNHDAYLSDEDRISKMGMKDKYYTIASEGLTMIVLDQNDAEEIGRGGIGTTQTIWLEKTLKDLEEQGEQAIVFGHYPLLAAVADGHMMTNPKPILDILNKFSSTVIAYLAGHAHKNLRIGHNNIIHCTASAILEEEGCIIVSVYNTSIHFDDFNSGYKNAGRWYCI